MNYFFRPWPVLPLALLRIGLGAAMFWHYAWLAPDFRAVIFLLSPDLPIGQSGLAVYGLLAGLLTSAALTALGLFTRPAVFLLFFCHSISYFANAHAYWAWAPMARHFLFFLLITPCGARLSLDIVWRGRPRADFMPAWCARLFQFQVCLIYLICVLHRTGLREWWDGTFFAKAMIEDNFARFPGLPWAEWMNALKPLSWLTILLEHAGAALFMFGPLQGFVAVALIAFHAGMELLIRVQLWPVLIMLTLLMFLPPAWWRIRATPPVYQARRWIAALISVFFLWMLAAAWPQDRLSPGTRAVQDVLDQPLELLTLNDSRNLVMFKWINYRSRICIEVFGASPHLGERPLYDNLEDCRSPVRLFEDIPAKTIQALMFHQNVWANRLLGDYFCGLAPDLRSVRWEVRFLAFPPEADTILLRESLPIRETIACRGRSNPPSRRR